MKTRTDSIRILSKNLIFVFILYIIKPTDAVPPAQISAPDVTIINDRSLLVSFNGETNVTVYTVTLSPRHGTTDIVENTTNIVTTVTNLTGSTLYDVSVQAINSDGEVGEKGNITPAQTHPSPPTIHTNTIPQPNVALLFFDTPNRARVSQWTVEYRVFNSSNVTDITTKAGQYYVLGLSNLLANTVYEVRARASQINSVKDLTESESVFSEWQNVTTGLLDLFGRADLVKVNYTAEQSIDNSTEQNLILANLQYAYLNKSNGGIKILEVSPNPAGKARVYFGIKILDTQLPTSTNFSLPEKDYENVSINNNIPDAEPVSPSVTYGLDSFSLNYEAENEKAVVVMGATVTRENLDTVKLSIILRTQDDTGGSDVFNSRKIVLDSKEPAASDETLYNVTANKIVGMTPEFLVREDGEDTYKVYRNNIPTDDDPDILVSSLFFTTDLDASILNINDVTYVSASDGTEVTITIPAVEKAIRYEIINGSKSMASLEEADIDGSDKVKIKVPSLEKGTTYTFNIGVTTRTNEGTEYTYSEYQIDVTPTIACTFNSSESESFFPVFQEITATTLTLDWTAVPNVDKYSVSVQCTNCANDETNTRSSTTPPVTFTDLQPGCAYKAYVKADLCYNAIRTPLTECITTTLVPASITEVNTTVGAEFVILTWELVTGADFYVILFQLVETVNRRKRAAGIGILTKWTNAVPAPPYTEREVCAGTSYTFSVAAGNKAGIGAPYKGSLTTKNNPSPTTPTQSSQGTSEISSTIGSETPESSTTSISSEPTTTLISSEPTTTTLITPLTSIFTSSDTETMITITTQPSTQLTSTDTPTSFTATPIIVSDPTTDPTTDTTSDGSETPIDTTGTTYTKSTKPTQTSSQTDGTSAPDTSPRLPWWFILAIVLAIVIITACVVGVVIYCKRRALENEYA